MNKAQQTNTNNPYIDGLMQQQGNNFFVEVNEAGERIYHWIDTRVDMLSSRKLWDILRLSEMPGCEIESAFIKAITDELISRRDYFGARPLLPSH
ncbi:hypothetical protein [Porticoccus sp.]